MAAVLRATTAPSATTPLRCRCTLKGANGSHPVWSRQHRPGAGAPQSQLVFSHARAGACAGQDGRDGVLGGHAQPLHEAGPPWACTGSGRVCTLPGCARPRQPHWKPLQHTNAPACLTCVALVPNCTFSGTRPRCAHWVTSATGRYASSPTGESSHSCRTCAGLAEGWALHPEGEGVQ